MKVIEGSERFPSQGPAPAVALGNFDGVHLGHRELLRRAREAASRHGGVSAAYTFEPHPVRILAPAACPPLLCTLPQKLALLEREGIDAVIVEPFTQDFSRQEPRAFFEEVVVRRLRTAAVITGIDFTFGQHRRGTVETFQELGGARGVEIIVVPPVFVGETLVSSTAIRDLVRAGSVEDAAVLLGHPYEIMGTVVRGRGIGRELAARTANIEPQSKLLPRDGVYLTRARAAAADLAGAAWRLSITSVGENPTFPDGVFSIETHLIDADVDLMGALMAVEFLARLRDQVRFASTGELRDQIAHDIALARELHERRSA